MVKKGFPAHGEAQLFGGKDPFACRHGGHVDARSLALAQVCAFAGHCAVIGTGCCVCRGAPPVPLPGGLLTPSTALGTRSVEQLDGARFHRRRRGDSHFNLIGIRSRPF